MEIAITTLSTAMLIWAFFLSTATLTAQSRAFEALGYASRQFDCIDLEQELTGSQASSVTVAGINQPCLPQNISSPSPSEDSFGYQLLLRLAERLEETPQP